MLAHRTWIAAAGCLLLAGLSPAQTTLSQEEPTLNRKMRNLGMGNVGVAIEGTADSSPFYNPAGLNDVEKGRFQFFSPTLEVSAGVFGVVTDVADLVDNVNNAATDGDKTREYKKFLDKNSGDFQHARYTLEIFNYARRNFAAGLLLEERIDLSFRDPSYPHFDVRNLGDVAMYVSGSHDFFEKLIQVGVTLRPTIRFALDQADESVTLADILGTDPSSGDPLIAGQVQQIYKKRRFGIGADVGLKSNLAFEGFRRTKFHEVWKPAVGVTWQDIGSPDFGGATGNESSVSAGVAVHPPIWKLKNTVGFDVRGINRETPLLSKLHFGVESKLPWIVSVRGGMSQGYFTAGAGADFWIMKVDAAAYLEEVGSRTRQEGDLRWGVTVAFNI